MAYCTWCGNEIQNLTKAQRDGLNRRGRVYCSKECGKAFARTVSSKTASDTNRRCASDRMKANNPMKKEISRDKMRSSLAHRPPSTRGGNGRGLTRAQKSLLSALSKYGPVPEYAVRTIGSPYPMYYKIDIAIPAGRIAIEIDGRSHRSLNRQKEDWRKTDFLKIRGWKVFRFTNEEVIGRLSEIVCTIEEALHGTQAVSERVS